MPSKSDLHWTPATELRQLIRTKKLSPVELLRAILARIDVVDKKTHAFITLDAERAMDTAKALESQPASGLLHGIPVSIKDLEQTGGLRTTFGSKFFENNVPAEDGALVERLRKAGAVITGKTNTPHFGHKDMCDNLIAPTTVNPWNPTRTSGASSGGAGAATAAGLGPIAHGSDGAGSIRIPSSLCGIYGLKPSFGRVPYWPNSDIWAARSHNGPMTRTVRDAALFLSAAAGPDPRDPVTLDAQPISWLSACDGDLKGLKVAWSADFGYARLDPEVRAIAERAAKRFGELGCEVEETNPGWDDPKPFGATMWDASYAYRNYERWQQNRDWFEPTMAAMIERGLKLSAVDLGKASMARSTFYDQAQRFMSKYDLLLTPQMPCTAWPHDGVPTIAGKPAPEIFDRVPFTHPFNMTGWPAASVPCGFDAQGLPVGLQIVGGFRQDALVLKASACFEALQPWADKKPAI